MNFQEHYAELGEDQLLMIAASRRELMTEAAAALDSEMTKRGLSYDKARAKKKEAARLEFADAKRHRSASTGSKYFVARMNGWAILLIAVGLPALLIVLMFVHVVPEVWMFPIFSLCMGAVTAIFIVKPWVRQTASFWLSLVVSCAVQLAVGFWLSVHLAPRSRGEIKGAGFLTLIAGYAVGVALFLLAQKLKPEEASDSKSL